VQKSFFLLLFIFSNYSTFAQSQIGSAILGEAAIDDSGRSVVFNSDGSILAIGARYNNYNTGHVRIYERYGQSWVQKGTDINGENFGDESGTSVAISDNGNIVAICAPKNDANSFNTGHVRVYNWNGSQWLQKGIDIDGPTTSSLFGTSIAMNGNGNIISIGSNSSPQGGYVIVYEWHNGQWQKRGINIYGETNMDLFGYSVSLNNQGNILAAGGIFNNGNGIRAGNVRVYEWNSIQWNQIGSDLDGEGTEDRFGFSTSLSRDGLTLAVGAEYNSGNGLGAGHVRVFTFNLNQWVQKGVDLDGDATNERFGWSVSIDSSGNRLVVGAPLGLFSSQRLGQAQLFEWGGTNWQKIGATIKGKAASDNAGTSVSISSSGDYFAVGSPGNDDRGTNAGHVRVYCFPTQSKEIIRVCDSLLWRDGIVYRNSTNTPSIILINSKNCDSIITLNLKVLSNSNIDFQTTCDSIIWKDGNTYFRDTNTPSIVYQNFNGCDSVVYLNLKLLKDSVIDKKIVCDSLIWIDGNTYGQNTNAPFFTLTNSYGCDSVVNLNLLISSDSTRVFETACESYQWIDGVIYTQSTDSAKVIFSNSLGCDSVVYLDLIIKKSSKDTVVVNACNSYTWKNGVTYTTSQNNDFILLRNAVGCDSIIYLDLTINNSDYEIIQVNECDSFTWINNITYYESTNSPTLQYINQFGCDSIVNLNLQLTTIDISIYSQQNILSVNNQFEATYQWLNCDSNNLKIPNAIKPSYAPYKNGNYACSIILNGCNDTTHCLFANPEDLRGNQIKIYPNPTRNTLTIEFSPEAVINSFEIRNSIGQVVSIEPLISQKKYILNTTSLAAGNYLMKLKINEEIKVLKFIKQ
jgi:hypothetical protein